MFFDIFPYTTERAKTAVDQVGRTVRQMTYFLSSRAMWRQSVFYRNESWIVQRKGSLFICRIQRLSEIPDDENQNGFQHYIEIQLKMAYRKKSAVCHFLLLYFN